MLDWRRLFPVPMPAFPICQGFRGLGFRDPEPFNPDPTCEENGPKLA